MAGSRPIRKTKVIATIGPASDSIDTIREMIKAGMNVARLNFSHGTADEHLERVRQVRQASAELGANIAIMLDTKGMEIRTGEVEGGAALLLQGQSFTLYPMGEIAAGAENGHVGDTSGVAITHRELHKEVRLGAAVLLDDGLIELRVTSISEDGIRTEVLRGGELGNRKGVNVPDSALDLGEVARVNYEDVAFAVKHDVDYIAASFMRTASDVREMRKILDSFDSTIPIIAKIENFEGVENLDEIIAAADGTMVARGDLGVEMPVQEVPIIQKRIIRRTVMSGKPVITATQMLDSMERNNRPTRAEVSDVANAILDGTSAVMLSGETAKGLHPVEAVRTMSILALEAEASLSQYGDLQQILPHPANVVTEAVAQAAITMAAHLKAAAIITLSASGFTARSISKYRPDCPNMAVTTSPDVVRKLAMNWGVVAVLYEGEGGDDAQVAHGIQRAHQLGCLDVGDVVVVTAGVSREAGSTNMIRVVTVAEGHLA